MCHSRIQCFAVWRSLLDGKRTDRIVVNIRALNKMVVLSLYYMSAQQDLSGGRTMLGTELTDNHGTNEKETKAELGRASVKSWCTRSSTTW